ncbi:hypothetical protein ACEPPN_018776 [Leptodophora sp. 'Broadleaf-Isolate-01']
MSDNIWTPEIIATVVYRVVMVFVSLAFIWKEYRCVRPQLDEEQLIGILIPRQSIHTALGVASGRENDQVNTHSAPRLRDHFRANSNNIVRSIFGLEIDTTSSYVATPTPLRAPTTWQPRTVSHSGTEPLEPSTASELSSRATSQTASRSPVSSSTPYHHRTKDIADIPMHPIHPRQSLCGTTSTSVPARSIASKNEGSDK